MRPPPPPPSFPPPPATVAAPGATGQRSLRMRPPVLADSFQPARASVRAIRSFPPKPASSIVLTTALATSAKRRTGGFGSDRPQHLWWIPLRLSSRVDRSEEHTSELQ